MIRGVHNPMENCHYDRIPFNLKGMNWKGHSIHTQRNLFEIFLNQTEINHKMGNTI